MKEDKMKIMCKWCNVSIHCHIVSEEISEHHGAYGIDNVREVVLYPRDPDRLSP